MKDLYRVLGASPWATDEDLHRAYRAQARRLHPDGGGDDESMRELNDAWAILGDPELRAEYDGMLFEDGAEDGGAGVPAGPPGWVRRAPVVAVLAILLAIFVLTAYVGSATQVLRK